MTKVLGVDFQIQANGYWCWAAVASMVSKWYAKIYGGSGMSQCEVASKLADDANCCNSPTPQECMALKALEDALGAVGHYVAGNASGELSTVSKEIDADRPLCALMKYWNGIFHFVLVTGYSDEQDVIVVCDPAGGAPFSTPTSTFFSSYNNGGACWDRWYFTQ